jgi:hypothetical protein
MFDCLQSRHKALFSPVQSNMLSGAPIPSMLHMNIAEAPKRNAEMRRE